MTTMIRTSEVIIFPLGSMTGGALGLSGCGSLACYSVKNRIVTLGLVGYWGRCGNREPLDNAWRTTTDASLVCLDAYRRRRLAQARRDLETAAYSEECCLMGCEVSERSWNGRAGL